MPIKLKCPACDLPLQPRQTGWVCDNGHQFDRAKRGYTHLLLPQHMRSKSPGDDKAMVLARQRFLQRDRYAPLMHAIDQLIVGTPHQWLDLGCGEGWYTEQLAQRLGAENGIGLDISKPAVDMAARRLKALTWLVASGARMPVFDQQLDAVFVMFTRLFPEELHRTLRGDGHLYVVGTGEDHLMPLRQTLYDQVRQSPFDAATHLSDRFTLLHCHSLRFSWQPEDHQELTDLLAMTPHQWRTSPESHQRLSSLVGQPMNAHFELQCWQPR